MKEQAADDNSPLLGEGRWTYRMVNSWASLPDGWVLGEVAGVAVDA